MRTVTAAFETAIRRSHRLATRATVLAPDGTETNVPIVDGSVTQDRTAQIRGRCDVALVDDGNLGLIPNDAGSLLAPYGNELRLSRGLIYPDGSEELVALGVFRIQSAAVGRAAGSRTIRIAGLDRNARFVDARFEQPYNIAESTNYAGAILQTGQDAWPGVEYDFTSSDRTTPSLFAQEGDDRAKFLQDMAAALAMRLYFDGDGIWRLVPAVLSAAVAAFVEEEGGVLLTSDDEWTREGAYNRVIATGENTGQGAPVRGVATDDNPLSPTYYYGPFGKVPRFYASPLLTTDDQCAAAAQSILDDELGATQRVNFGTLVLPHLEPDDTVTISRADGQTEDHVIDSLTIPLTPGAAMTGTTRARSVTA